MIGAECEPLEDFHPSRSRGSGKAAPPAQQSEHAEEGKHQNHSCELLKQIHENRWAASLYDSRLTDLVRINPKTSLGNLRYGSPENYLRQ